MLLFITLDYGVKYNGIFDCKPKMFMKIII